MKTQIFKAFQQRLKKLGYYKGQIDGVAGAMSSHAVIEFKRNNDLTPRAYVGPLTMAALFGDAPFPAPKPRALHGEPLWLSEARRLLGTKETRGKANNPVIMDWADELDQWYPGDDVPWCGLFVAHCMAVGVPNEPQGFNRLGARAWLKYGKKCQALKGSVAVFWRTHKTKSGNGHVGFIVGEDASTWHILGGNQSDSVSVTRVSKTRLLGCRAPRGWVGGGSNLSSVSSGALSTNEA